MDSKPQKHVTLQKPSKSDCAELQKLSLASCYFLGKCAKMLKQYHDTFSKLPVLFSASALIKLRAGVVPLDLYWPCFVGCKLQIDPSVLFDGRMAPLPVLCYTAIPAFGIHYKMQCRSWYRGYLSS